MRSYTMGINQHTDMTFAEFSGVILSSRLNETDFKLNIA